MKYRCAHCGKKADRPSSHVNRAHARGMNLYCGRRCSGLGRRKGKTKAQKQEEKRLYDIDYHAKNRARLLSQKREYHKRTYDTVKAAKARKKRMPQHVEYCRQPWYKEWKREYDARYRASEFGAFADAYRLTLELNREIKRRFSHEEIKYQEGSRNKAQRRKREAGQAERGNRHSAADGG
jgi:hypothetical protein